MIFWVLVFGAGAGYGWSAHGRPAPWLLLAGVILLALGLALVTAGFAAAHQANDGFGDPSCAEYAYVPGGVLTGLAVAVGVGGGARRVLGRRPPPASHVEDDRQRLHAPRLAGVPDRRRGLAQAVVGHAP
ncbi:MAG TPA: hypothetical protein VHX88_17695 [Solirubrobacteraceae bacterium]|jgi:hypothetical protein|nr:hypothetical protein [Solirubrobacteraceae bacterium]